MDRYENGNADYDEVAMHRQFNAAYFANPIVSPGDDRLVEFGRSYYGRGDRLGDYSNFFVMQGARSGDPKFYKTDIDFCGYWDRRAFAMTLTDSSDFNQRDEQMYEGAAYVNWVYRVKELMPVRFAHVPTDKFSFAQFAAESQNNTWLHTTSVKHFVGTGEYAISESTHPWNTRLPGLIGIETSGESVPMRTVQ